MEEKIYRCQVNKISLALCIVDDKPIEPFYTKDDLVYYEEPVIEKPLELKKPGEEVLAEVYLRYNHYIYDYRNDSLSENQVRKTFIIIYCKY